MQRFQKAKCFLAVFLLVISLFVGILPANASLAAVVADGTFGEDDKLTWVLEDSGLLIISGKGKMQDMYVQDYPWYAYADLITAVKIQDGVQNVGTYMFEEYDNLETAEIGESVLVIGKYSFNYCDNLRSVTIPKSLRRVDEQAFFMCPLLTDVHIADASLWCGLEFMSAHANPLYNGADLLLDGKIVTEISVPDFVTEIGAYQFYGCQSLEKIKLHADVTVIGTAAFGNCPSLRAIYCEKADDQIHKILDTNSELSKELFVVSPDEQDKITDGDVIEKDGVLYSADMTVLRGFTGNVAAELVVPETVTKIADGAFRNCFTLQTIALPDTVTELPDSLFENCRNLQAVRFSDNLCAVGSRAFSGCIRLADVSLPETVSAVGTYAFASCRALQAVTLPNAIAVLTEGVFSDCVRLAEIKLPQELTAIGDNAFYNCYNLKAITLPETVTNLGASAFEGCAALTEMSLPEAVTELPERIFYACYNLAGVSLPNGLESIGAYAFYDCIKLAGLLFPDTLGEIGEYAFHGCESLTEVLIPAGVGQLAEGVFMACLQLSRLTLPQELQSVGKFAFAYCQTLSVLYMPASVTAVDADAFFRCSALKEMYAAGTSEQWTEAFHGDLPAVSVSFDHVHTPGKWSVTAYPQPDKEGIAVNNCALCNARSTANIPAIDLVCDGKITLGMDGFITAVSGQTAAMLLSRAQDGAAVATADGEPVAQDARLGTGMLLTLADGTQYELLVVGDVTGDGLIMADDARFVLRFTVGLEEAEIGTALLRACDVDDMQTVSSSDARSILRVAVGLDSENDWKR